ncbi:hypothetical protein [Haloplanus salinarum]|uniref:hypothetical protein n=1 Tax=Haloplanus salinarum TaxID=1912324 RepID=UPI00214CE790|nr:hypothetical protein [Haloplanus salinarum]
MPREPPTPPAALPTEFAETLDERTPDQLRSVARYAESLAEHKARATRLEAESDENGETESDGDGNDERLDDRPEDVPSKATITVKEINDNRYYYWQWRDGETVTSKYKAPVDPDE